MCKNFNFVFLVIWGIYLFMVLVSIIEVQFQVSYMMGRVKIQYFVWLFYVMLLIFSVWVGYIKYIFDL